MLAARWDSGAELGGGWRRVLRRRTTGTNPIDLAMVGPASMKIWGPAGATDEVGQPLPPRLEVPGLVSSDRAEITLTLSAAQVTALGVGEWEFAVMISDPESGGPVVLSRGYFRVSGSVVDW